MACKVMLPAVSLQDVTVSTLDVRELSVMIKSRKETVHESYLKVKKLNPKLLLLKNPSLVWPPHVNEVIDVAAISQQGLKKN